MGVKIQNATPPTNYSQKFSQTSPEFSSQWSSQNYVLDFEILSLRFLALLDFVSRATVMAQASVVRRSSVVRRP